MKYHVIADCTVEADNITDAQRKLGDWLIHKSLQAMPSPLTSGNFTMCPWGTYRPNHPAGSSSSFSEE